MAHFINAVLKKGIQLYFGHFLAQCWLTQAFKATIVDKNAFGKRKRRLALFFIPALYLHPLLSHR